MKRKVIFYFMIIILLTLGLVMLGFVTGIRQYYYQGIVNTIQNHVESVQSVLEKQTNLSNSNLRALSDEIIKNYQLKGVELQLLKRDGQLIQSSTGFYEDKTYLLNPSILTLKIIYKIEENGYSGEKIICVYTPLTIDGQVVGILRYSTSLTKVNSLIINLLGYGMIVCTVIALIVFILSLHLGNIIVRPLNDIISFTKKIANGNYKEKIEKVYPHEFGEIAKTLNYMGDEILKTDRLKNEFISSISHELRTPLTGIKGWIETMQSPNEMTDEELRFGLKIINGESERLINLVEKLLDFSRYQADRIDLNISKFNLDELIREGAFQLQKKAEKKEIRVIVEAIPFIFKADRDKLKQVILNVLDNAIKFSYKDSSIYVTQAVNNNSVIIQISDSGIGIKEEELEYVMRSFYKIDPKSIGAGLGLVISRNIVEMHKGTIQIESEYGKGTSVIITLPLIE